MECNWVLLLLIFMLTLLSKVLKVVIGPLYKLVAGMVSPKPSHLHRLRKEVRKARAQLQSLNQMDDFAEYSRTQRSLTRIEGQLQSVEKAHVGGVISGVSIAQWMCTLLILLGRLVVILTYRGSPVLVMSPQSVWPLEKLLSFPTGVPGGIGVPSWTLMCSVAIDSLATGFRYWL